MKICVALLRGINVGGKNALPMKELVAVLDDLGAKEVKTYIQSGNAVSAWAGGDAARLPEQIRAEIKKRRGFAPHVLLLGLEDLEGAIRQNPFPEAEADPKALHAGFLAAAPERPDLKTLEGLRSSSERFRLIGSVFYLHAPAGGGPIKACRPCREAARRADDGAELADGAHALGDGAGVEVAAPANGMQLDRASAFPSWRWRDARCRFSPSLSTQNPESNKPFLVPNFPACPTPLSPPSR
ncbi:MAG TPA: DUF1697 domain-containing protein [Pyrinomonadaceae bacterium]|jgi:uncharacterized protein (DUF1697 family)